MANETVAKFIVTEVANRTSGATVTLNPVTGNSPENQRFYSYTPAGSIVLTTVNKRAAENFVPGGELYVTFTTTLQAATDQNQKKMDLVSFGNYLLHRYGVQVGSNDGSNTPLYSRQVTHADLSNWRDAQLKGGDGNSAQAEQQQQENEQPPRGTDPGAHGSGWREERGPFNPPKPPGDQPRG